MSEISGPYFEDFTLGMEYDAPAVTLTSGHAAQYQATFGDRLRLPLDHHASAQMTGSATALVHPLLATHVAIGQSTWASQRVKANLFYRGMLLQSQVFLGDTLHTLSKVVGLRQNRFQPGRAATGIVALEMHTRNQRGATVLQGWRCPMIPCRDDTVATGHVDLLEHIGATPDAARLVTAAPLDWLQSKSAASWRGARAADFAPGDRVSVVARDTITSAPELVRLTLNMAMAHTDSRLSYLGDRLVYGVHVVSTAFAQLTRALPNLVTIIAWERCDHLAPALENDRLRSEATLLDITTVAGGAILKLRAETWAARGASESETRVLDWTFWALSL